MHEGIYPILLMIVLVTGACVGAFYIRNILTRRAIAKVVRSFYRHNALGTQNAKTLRELGLKRPNLVARAVSPRDYRQQALQLLVKQGIVRVNADGLVYMVEENLAQNLRCRGNGG
jgi:hypothetical protein